MTVLPPGYKEVLLHSQAIDVDHTAKNTVAANHTNLRKSMSSMVMVACTNILAVMKT